MSRRPQYADSSAYSGKFRQLQQRALATMRTKVQQVLRQASEQVSENCIALQAPARHCSNPVCLGLALEAACWGGCPAQLGSPCSESAVTDNIWPGWIVLVPA